jgi:hypothetical protein
VTHPGMATPLVRNHGASATLKTDIDNHTNHVRGEDQNVYDLFRPVAPSPISG